MRFLRVFLLTCLLLAVSVSAVPVDSIEISMTKVSPGIGTGIYTPLAFTECSDDSASVGTPVTMGELNVDSIPDGASVSLDGTPWAYTHCVGGFPKPSCFSIPIRTPYSGSIETGTHTIAIALAGHTTYSGTVRICSQKVSYVHKTLNHIPTATTTSPTTVVTTSAPATATTSAAITATTAAASTTPSSAATAAITAAITVATPAATVPAQPPGTGSLSIITAPAGAAVYVDGVQRGISPVVIPGLAAGSHTVLLKLDGYEDLSAPVSITSGSVSEFSPGLTPLVAGPPADSKTTDAAAPRAPATQAQSPGFEAALGLSALGVLLHLRTVLRR